MPAPLTAPYSRGLRIAEADDHSSITYNVMTQPTNPIGCPDGTWACRERATPRARQSSPCVARLGRSWEKMAATGGKAMRIGFVGIGTMGSRIAGCLIAAGHELIVHDVRPKAVEALAAQGAALADNAAAAARESEVVFTSLPGPKEVEEALFAPRIGLLAGLRKDSAYIDLTTNSPDMVRRLAEA